MSETAIATPSSSHQPASSPNASINSVNRGEGPSHNSAPSTKHSGNGKSGSGRGRGRARGRGGPRNNADGGKSAENGTVIDTAPVDAAQHSSGAYARCKVPRRNRGRGPKPASAPPDQAVADGDATGQPSSQKSTNGASKPVASNRRKQFGGRLTGAVGQGDEEGETASSNKPVRKQRTKAIPIVAPAAEHIDYADLRSRLLAELASGQYDCVVCYSTVTTKQAVWSCSQCHTVLHLGCVRKWADSSVKKVEEQNAMQEDPEIRNRRGTWRCPGCQYACEDVPKVYWCWCGRTQDPVGGRGANPHGCGQRCSSGKCSHGCADQCHPGPCPPCAVTVSQQCYCGAETIPMRCSQSSSRTPSLAVVAEKGITCGCVCGKKLDCDVHSCNKVCHPGKCDPCAVQLGIQCYCGKNTKQMRCGDGQKRISHGEEGQQWQGSYDCGNLCERKFDCGVHSCKRSCHPQDAQKTKCPASPDLIKTCPCGATPAAYRLSCKDPVPVCGNVCSKPFPCGHSCPSNCHIGPCPPCNVPVSTPCRCGESKETRPCHIRQREESEGEQEVLCEMTCKAVRNCGRHQCGRQCCPLSFQAKTKPKKRRTQAELQMSDPAGFHDCSIPCTRPLACGSHDCPMTCHRGPCPPCLQASFEELICHCGRTVMEPPVPCGVHVICNFPCTRPPPSCGHPKVPHSCHEEEQCPPCVFLTEKVCHCQKHIVKNVPCSRFKVSCGQACVALLNCGYHRCQGICHDAPNQCAPCDQMCGKPRKLCLHPCQEKCHAPSSCPETAPCQAVITLQCACGNLQSRAKCGVSIHNPTKEKGIKCNDSCIIAQRNAKLAEALGLNPAEKSVPAAYDHETLLFYSVPANRKFCEDLEAALNDFIRSPRAVVILPPANKLQRKFTHELAAVYKLVTESLDSEPRRSVSVRRKQDSRIPTPLISEAFAAAKVSLMAAQLGQTVKPSVGLAQLRKEPPAPLNAVYLPGVFGQDQDSLRSLLQQALKDISFNIIWKGDEDLLVTSNDSPTRLVMSKRELKALLRRKRFARDVVLCAVDPTGRIVRKEDEPALGMGAGSARPAGGTAWGPSRSANASGASTPRLATGNRGWAAVAAAGSGRSSPVPPIDVWGHCAPAAAANADDASSRSARIIPNPNAPRRAATPPPPSSSDSVPESWEDE